MSLLCVISSALSLLSVNCSVYEFAVCELYCLWVCCVSFVVSMSLLCVIVVPWVSCLSIVVSTWIWCLWILVSMSFLFGNCGVYMNLMSVNSSIYGFPVRELPGNYFYYDMSYFSMNFFIYESAVCELLCIWVCYLLIIMSMGVLSMNFHVFKFNVCELSCHEKYCLWFGNL